MLIRQLAHAYVRIIGEIEDPCRCCLIDQHIKNINGDTEFIASGSICQVGICCPCISDPKFAISKHSRPPRPAFLFSLGVLEQRARRQLVSVSPQFHWFVGLVNVSSLQMT